MHVSQWQLTLCVATGGVKWKTSTTSRRKNAEICKQQQQQQRQPNAGAAATTKKGKNKASNKNQIHENQINNNNSTQEYAIFIPPFGPTFGYLHILNVILGAQLQLAAHC